MKSWNNTEASRRISRMLPLTLILALFLFTLACTFLRPTARSISKQVVGLTRLPTFTRTPLPPFTATPTATPPLVAATDAPVTVPEALPSSMLPTPQLTLGVAPSPVLETVSPAVASLSSTPSDTPTPLPNLSSPELPPGTISDTTSPASQPVAAIPVDTPPPTDLPTPMPTDTPLPTATLLAPATEEPPPTATTTPTETPIPLPAGWVFSKVRSVPMPGGRYSLLHGILFNNTGTTQTLNEIRRIFPDDLDLSSASNDRAYYPVTQISQGGQIPFKLLIVGQSDASDFELEVVASESGNSPHQTFEFLEVNAVIDEDEYCVVGKIRNSGSELSDYLIVASILYDDEDKVINYNTYNEESLGDLVGDQTRQISICTDPLNQDVARYELQAWGL